MTDAAQAEIETGRIVRFTTRQVEKLARAAGVSVDEVRQAARMAVKPDERRDFLHILGMVHASKQKEIASLPQGRERFGRMNQIGIDLKSVWLGDADVRELVADGLEQGRTNNLPKSEPGPFSSWIERVRNFNEPAPAPAMARL